MRVTYEIEPADAAQELARIETTGVPCGPERVRARVLSAGDGRAVLEFPPANWSGDVTLLVASLFAGEWADSAAFARCRLVGVDWAEAGLPGPAFDAPERVLVGAIVKPSLGLSPREFAETAAALARGGADLVKDDELLGDQHWCPLEERVPRVVEAVGPDAVYAVNVTGSPGSLLRRAERAVELGARAVMLTVFAQGLGALAALRAHPLGVPIFAHRVGGALWTRGRDFGVSGPVVAELTRLLGADYVQVGSFTSRVFDREEDVRAQVDACRRRLDSARRAVGVLGGGVGPANAAEQVVRSGATAGVMALVGSAAYAHPGGAEEGVRATVEAVSAWR